MESLICKVVGAVVISGFAAYGFFTYLKKSRA
jgi:hypothetical protein